MSVVPRGRGSTRSMVVDRVEEPALWSPLGWYGQIHLFGSLAFVAVDRWSGGPTTICGGTNRPGPSPSSLLLLLRMPGAK